MNYHLCIIYDGIANSVFESQLLVPFAQRITAHSQDHGLLISFERAMPEDRYLQLVKAHPQISLIILKKTIFLGSLSLRYAAYQLEKALAPYTIVSVLARGPLAGWIAGHTKAVKDKITIVQARGLAGQEYAYANSKKIIHQLRTYQYERIEQWCYGTYVQKPHVTIHAVSSALKEYLVLNFKALEHKITVETYDIPAVIANDQKALWREQIRSALGIAQDAYVYVYSGSAKAWQCPQETVAYAAAEYKKNTNTFLLILSQDSTLFPPLCAQYNLPENRYCSITVSYAEIYRYLAAADAGIILRESHPINWVSRPTKIVEYQAVGLKIVHNNTIGMLSNL